jgi:hypothetical protein
MTSNAIEQEALMAQREMIASTGTGTRVGLHLWPNMIIDTRNFR